MGNPDKMPEHQPSVGCSGSQPGNPDPNGSGRIIPGPAAMADGSKAPKHIGVSGDAETPAINQNSNGITGMTDLPAGNNSSQPCPIQYPSSPPQLLQHDIIGCQYIHNVMQQSLANLISQLQKSHAELFKLHQKTSKEISEQALQIAKLTVVSPLPILSAISNCYLV